MAGHRFDDVDLQVAYQAWMRSDRGAHLDDAAWQRLGAGDAVPSERNLSFAHIMTCAECSAVWRSVWFLRQQAESEGLIERRSTTPRALFRSMFIPIAIAATLIAAVGSVMLTRQSRPQPETVRGTSELAVIEGLMMAYDRAGVPTLVWPPAAGAARYRLEVFSADGRSIWSAEVTAPPARWPDTTPRVKGAYRWRVEAIDGDGVIARSRLTAMEIR